MSTILGINSHQCGEFALRLAASLHPEFVRCDVNGYDVWPARDRFNWGWLDDLIKTSTDLGMQVYPTISYSPKWLGPRNRPMPEEDWRLLIQTFGERYAGKIQFVGIWNEPNIRGLYDGEVGQYFNETLQPASETLRAIDPTYQICGPDLSTTGQWRSWIQTLLSRGRHWLDVLTVHAYATHGREVLTKLRDVREVMRISGALDLTLALTEFGWNSARISEEDQANYCDQFLEAAQSVDWLETAFWFNLINESTQTQWGLFRSDGTEKPVAAVFRRYAGRNDMGSGS